MIALAVLVLLPLLATDARAEGEAVRGTMRSSGEPVVGAVIVVRDADGGDVGEAVSDDAGEWRVELPGPGDYEIELLTDTLPDEVALRDPGRNPFTITVREGRDPPVNFAFGEVITGPGIGERIGQQTVNGLKFGLIIAITAVGLSLVFGTTGLINFAHGEFVTFGAVLAWVLNRQVGIPLVVATVVAVVAGVAFGAGLEAGVFRRLRQRRVSGFQFLVITVGLGLLMQSILRLWFGSGRQPYADFRATSSFALGPVNVLLRDAAIIALCTAVCIGMGLLLQGTRIGKAMRAVADNRDLAEASGIDVARVVLVVWAVGSGLAALGGVLQGLASSVEPLLGFKLLLLMFAAVILGGLGTAYGAMVGGLVIGLISEVSTVWFSDQLKSAWALTALIAVLLVRPQGLLGRRERVG